MKVIILISCFFGFAFAQDDRMTLPCHGNPNSSAEMANMWVCEFVQWKYIVSDWKEVLLEKCPQSMNPRQSESECPHESTFECCSGTQECQDVMGCKMCICKGGTFKNQKALFEVWKETKESYKYLTMAYDVCASTLSAPVGCEDRDPGSGSGGSGSGDFGSESGGGSGSGSGDDIPVVS